MKPLAGLGVVLTRPAGRDDALAARLAADGADVLRFPTLAIEPVAPPPPARDDQWRVFVSANAVAHAGPWLPAPAGCRVAAVGPATAAALAAAGVVANAAGADARGATALLADPRFVAGAGDRVSIVRGVGGSESLAEALRARGARVEYAEVYRRSPPADADPAPLLAAWRHGALHAVIVASDAALEHLHALLDAAGRRHLADTQLVGASPRVVDLARRLGIHVVPLVAADAGEAALAAALAAWWRTRPAR